MTSSSVVTTNQMEAALVYRRFGATVQTFFIRVIFSSGQGFQLFSVDAQ